MQVQDHIVKQWQLLYNCHDPADIAKITGYHKNTVKKACRTGNGPVKVIESLYTLYNERAQRLGFKTN